MDHGGGFKVYSHVTNIQTNVDSQVRNGDVIAYMGDSDQLMDQSYILKFQGKGQKLDPEKWLEKISRFRLLSTQARYGSS